MNFSSGKGRGEEEANYDDAVHDAVNFPSVGNGTKLAMTIVPLLLSRVWRERGERRVKERSRGRGLCEDSEALQTSSLSESSSSSSGGLIDPSSKLGKRRGEWG